MGDAMILKIYLLITLFFAVLTLVSILRACVAARARSTRTRRVLARYAGMDYNSSRSEIAARVAARSSLDAHKLETLIGLLDF